MLFFPLTDGIWGSSGIDHNQVPGSVLERGECKKNKRQFPEGQQAVGRWLHLKDAARRRVPIGEWKSH